jgi:hypothetical protein
VSRETEGGKIPPNDSPLHVHTADLVGTTT